MAIGEIQLDVDYFYNLTYRQFVNVINGYRNREEKLSQERLIIMRKMMYASLLPHLKKGAKETDIMQFDFEQNAVQMISEQDHLELMQEIEDVKQFWLDQDAKKNRC